MLLNGQISMTTWCRNPSAGQMNNLTRTLLEGSKLWLSYEAADVETPDTYTILLQGDTTCPLPTDLDESEDLSACPSYLVKEVDITRIPSAIVHARCRCEGCQIPGLRSRQRHQYACEPVYRFLPVLKRTSTCIDGEYEYTLAHQKVSVSCHCVRSRLSRPKLLSSNRKSPENFIM
ncbi:interleukin 17-like protein isoform X2 [Argopecten irradians]